MMSSPINEGTGIEGSTVRRASHEGLVTNDPRVLASEKRSADSRSTERFARLMGDAQLTAKPQPTTSTVKGHAEETSQHIEPGGGDNDHKTHNLTEIAVGDRGLHTSKLSRQAVAGPDARPGQHEALVVTGERTTDASLITKQSNDETAVDRNKVVMAGYLHGRGLPLDAVNDEQRGHTEPADLAAAVSADSFAMSIDPASAPSDAPPVAARTEIVELLEQMCSNLYVSGASETRESRILLAMDAALAGAAVELVRDGAFLKARLHARNEVALQLMLSQREQLHAVLEQASQLYVSVDVVEDE